MAGEFSKLFREIEGFKLSTKKETKQRKNAKEVNH